MSAIACPSVGQDSVASASSASSDSAGFTQSSSDGASSITKVSSSEFDQHSHGPPPPPKDIPQTPRKIDNILAKANCATTTTGFYAPQPPTEIWRRRSIKSVKELNLYASNGSSVDSVKLTLPPPKKPLPPIPPQRNTLKSKSRVRKPQASDVMGAESSKFEELRAKVKRKDSKQDVLRKRTQSPSIYQSLKSTFKAISPNAQGCGSPKGKLHKSPKSPVISKTTPCLNNEDQIRPIPRKSESRTTNHSSSTNDTIRPTPEQTEISSASAFDRRNTDSKLLDAAVEDSRDSSDALTIRSEPLHTGSPQHRRSSISTLLSPQAVATAPSLSSPIATIKSPPLLTQNNQRRNAHSRASMIRLFSPSNPAATGICSPPELNIVQLDCYQQNMYMRKSRNDICPVACMMCGNQDTELRWKCQWCCVRVCGRCMEVLRISEGNMRLALKTIGVQV